MGFDFFLYLFILILRCISNDKLESYMKTTIYMFYTLFLLLFILTETINATDLFLFDVF